MLNLGPKLCSSIKKYSFVVAAIANGMSHCYKQAGPFLTLNYEAGIPKCLAHTHSSTHHVRPFSFSVKAFLANRIVCVVLGVEWKSYVKTFLEFVFLSNYIVRILQDCFWQFIIPFWRIPSRLWESNSDLCSPALFLNFSI